jgi:hypothetical protein
MVHTDVSAYIALADAIANWQHWNTQCLSGKDLIGYNFFTIFKEEFVPVSIKPASEAQLGNVVFQGVRKRILSGYGITRSNIGLLRTICVLP